MTPADPNLIACIRRVVESIDEVASSNDFHMKVRTIVQPLRAFVEPECHMNLPEDAYTPQVTAEWYAGQLLAIGEEAEGGPRWAGLNGALNTRDVFAPISVL